LAPRSPTISGGAFAQPRATPKREIWKTFFNDRFGTTIEYPARFKPRRPPDNTDGQSFEADDGAELAVWGSLNTFEQDVAGLEAFLRENPKEGEQITYRARLGIGWCCPARVRIACSTSATCSRIKERW